MDVLAGMRLFVRVVERRSFTAAAADLELPRSTATAVLKRLEARLGARLLQRSTRHVAPTPEGEAYYARCVAILADIEDAERIVDRGEARGLLRVDMNGFVARSILLPHLPTLLDRHPGLRLQIGDGDRLVDLLRDGVDCVIRSGVPADSDLIVRRIGVLPETTCASPDYLRRHGTPRTPDELNGHRMVGFLSSRTGQALPLEFTAGGRPREIALPWTVCASSSETGTVLARLGYGLIQAPRHRLRNDIAAGRLVEVLTGYPPSPLPLSVLYPRNRQLSPRVRVFVDWAAEVVGTELAGTEP